ncbi:class I SAM-dependent methyltransferase [archaeon]|nr:class I SAM-dependent methyltransferase [archaeon]
MKKLNFGCGLDIKKGWDNIDIQTDERLTNSFNFNKIPYPIKSNTYDYIYMRMIIEHLEKPDLVLHELHRICKEGAIIRVITSYYNNKGSYNDMEHLHYFSDETFKHFVNETVRLEKKKKFEIELLELKPTVVGRIFPKFIREKLPIFIGGLIGIIIVDLKVKK